MHVPSVDIEDVDVVCTQSFQANVETDFHRFDVIADPIHLLFC